MIDRPLTRRQKALRRALRPRPSPVAAPSACYWCGPGVLADTSYGGHEVCQQCAWDEERDDRDMDEYGRDEETDDAWMWDE